MLPPGKPAPTPTELEARFADFVDRSAQTLADDFVRLLNRAHELGIVIDVGEEDPGATYEVTWLRGNTWKHVDIEWFAGMERWAVVKGE